MTDNDEIKSFGPRSDSAQPGDKVNPEVEADVVPSEDTDYNYKEEAVLNSSATNHSVVVPHVAVESALADMLQAWYQSGYMTGRYHTLLELQQQPSQDNVVVDK